MKDSGRARPGRCLFKSWVFRKQMHETRRPAMTGALSWLPAACGLVSIAEGIILAGMIAGRALKKRGPPGACFAIFHYAGTALRRHNPRVAFGVWSCFLLQMANTRHQ